MIEIKDNTDLKKMTTFGLPARCGRLVIFSEPLTDLPELDRRGLLDGAVILGGGSNMLFTAENPSLTVVHPAADTLSTLTAPDGSVAVTAQAGVVLDELCSLTASLGYWGLENLSGIPGHIGGAAVQNVGAYGTEFADLVESVTCYSTGHHDFVTFTNAECSYGYRDSIFKHLPAELGTVIVTEVKLRLSQQPMPRLGYAGLRNALASRFALPADVSQEEIARRVAEGSPEVVRQEVIALRDSKLPDPARTGSAGSFFKNPVVSPEELARLEAIALLPYHLQPDGSAKLSAAWLIDHAGCKPLTAGGAALWQSQPLVIVNRSGSATAADILSLEKAVIERVESKFGITLVPEVIHI